MASYPGQEVDVDKNGVSIFPIGKMAGSELLC